MKRLAVLTACVLLALSFACSALAEPAWGKSCLSCHDQLQTGLVYVYGEDTTADPDESQTGAPDRGTLPVFQTPRGETKALQVQVAGLLTDDTYAVVLKRLRFPGVETGGQLSWIGDCGWPEWGENAEYYSEPVIAYRWGAGPTDFTFNLDVEADADPDYYDVVFTVAGKLDDSGGLFYAEEHFYVQVLGNALGDLNCDGTVDNFDIGAFVLALTDPAGYEAAYPECDRMLADINGDGTVNNADIPPFVELLSGGR